MNINKYYVVICNCYSGDDSVSVFWNEADAYRCMIAEMETEIANLQNSGYEFVSAENDVSAELYVPDSDIYFEWDIKEMEYSLTEGRYGNVWISTTPDCYENEGGYYCEVYSDRDMTNRIDYFCIHPEDCDCDNDEEVEKFIAWYAMEYN